MLFLINTYSSLEIKLKAVNEHGQGSSPGTSSQSRKSIHTPPLPLPPRASLSLLTPLALPGGQRPWAPRLHGPRAPSPHGPRVALPAVAHSRALDAAAASIAAPLRPDCTRRQVPILISSPGGAHAATLCLHVGRGWRRLLLPQAAPNVSLHTPPSAARPRARPAPTPCGESVGFGTRRRSQPPARHSSSPSSLRP